MEVTELCGLFSVKFALKIINEGLGTNCPEGKLLQTNHHISEAVYYQSRAETKI